jgi:hypothetical protein
MNMTISTVIHVGEDFCMRIPVLENTGLRVLRSRCTAGEFRAALDQADSLAAVTLSDERGDLRETLLESGVIETARELCMAPLILFHNPNCACDESNFDLVIPTLTTPTLWLPSILEAIKISRQIRESSQQLCEESEAVRVKVRAEISRAVREGARSIDLDAVWRSKPPASVGIERSKTGTGR